MERETGTVRAMWKETANIIFNAVVVLVLAAALYASFGWPRETALFPQTVGTLILVLACISLGREIYAARKRSPGERTDTPAPDEEGTEDLDFFVKSVAMFAWLLGFGAGIWVLGFYGAAFFFLLLYIRLRAEITVLGSLMWAAGTVATIVLLFDVLLGVDLYRGLAWTLVMDLVG
jgi:hypothetical protein